MTRYWPSVFSTTSRYSKFFLIEVWKHDSSVKIFAHLRMRNWFHFLLSFCFQSFEFSFNEESPLWWRGFPGWWTSEWLLVECRWGSRPHCWASQRSSLLVSLLAVGLGGSVRRCGGASPSPYAGKMSHSTVLCCNHCRFH